MIKTLSFVVVALALSAWNGTRLLAQAETAGRDAAPDHAAGAVERPGDAGIPEAGGHDAAAHEAAAHGGEHEAGPVPPDTSHRWPAVVVFLILIMFFMAAVIGPIVRAHAPPPEMPATHSHDEPPGASHHHGHSGTINPVPEDVARLEQGHDESAHDDHGHDHGHRH